LVNLHKGCTVPDQRAFTIPAVSTGHLTGMIVLFICSFGGVIYLTTLSNTWAKQPNVASDCVRVNSALESKEKDAQERDRLGDPGVDGRIILR
jgi:hypothetical protein